MKCNLIQLCTYFQHDLKNVINFRIFFAEVFFNQNLNSFVSELLLFYLFILKQFLLKMRNLSFQNVVRKRMGCGISPSRRHLHAMLDWNSSRKIFCFKLFSFRYFVLNSFHLYDIEILYCVWNNKKLELLEKLDNHKTLF